MTSRSSWFESFGEGLANQLPAFTQAYWIGTHKGLFADPADGS